MKLNTNIPKGIAVIGLTLIVFSFVLSITAAIFILSSLIKGEPYPLILIFILPLILSNILIGYGLLKLKPFAIIILVFNCIIGFVNGIIYLIQSNFQINDIIVSFIVIVFFVLILSYLFSKNVKISFGKPSKYDIYISILFYIYNFISLYYFIKNIDIRPLNALKLNPLYFILSGLIFFLIYLLISLRHRLLTAHIAEYKLKDIFSSCIIGNAINTISPFFVGDIIRSSFLGKKKEISVSSIFATIFIEHFIDYFVLCIIYLPIIIFFHSTIGIGYVFLIIPFFILLIFILIKIKLVPFINLLKKIFKPLPDHFTDEIIISLQYFFSNFYILKKNNYTIKISILTIAIWICTSFYLFLSYNAFGLNIHQKLPISSIALIPLVFYFVFSNFRLFSSKFFFNYFIVSLLHFYGISKTISLNFAVLNYSLTFILLIGAGLLFIIREGLFYKNNKL